MTTRLANRELVVDLRRATEAGAVVRGARVGATFAQRRARVGQPRAGVHARSVVAHVARAAHHVQQRARAARLSKGTCLSITHHCQRVRVGIRHTTYF